jgi:putative redox protein
MIQTKHLEALAYTIQINAHRLISDVKSSSGGTDKGPDPHELIEAALGACTSITVQMYANHKGWNLKACDATVKFIQENSEGIVMERSLTLEGDLDESQKERLLQIAEKCPIHQLLTRGVKIDTKHI